MMGAFQDMQPIQMVETDRAAVSRSNLGISAVVPAYRLRELLLSQDLAAIRK
jgi:hypothetical protein